MSLLAIHRQSKRPPFSEPHAETNGARLTFSEAAPTSLVGAAATSFLRVIVIAEADEDLPIPDRPFSFSMLETAQALGDFQSLDHEGRGVLLVKLLAPDPESLRQLMASMLA